MILDLSERRREGETEKRLLVFMGFYEHNLRERRRERVGSS